MEDKETLREDKETLRIRESVNENFRRAVNYLLEKRIARNKTEVMESLGLYLGRLTLILGSKANVSTDNLACLVERYGVSSEFLLLGKEPILSGGPVVRVSGPKQKSLPLIPIAAIAGFSGIDESGVKYDDCVQYIVPEFISAGADFLIRVQGGSMTPTYVSGDLVACKRVEERSWIDYGEVYVIDGLQGVMIKRIYNDPENPESMICKSDNPEVPPFKISRSDIRSLSKVIGVIRNA